jgi:formyltetrahydrofolate deformylase
MSQSPTWQAPTINFMPENEHWVLTFVCPDKPGIVHAISGAVVETNGNITESKQFTSESNKFFMRLQIESSVSKAVFEQVIATIAEKYQMQWQLDVVGRPMKTLVLASKAAHCVNDMLFRQLSGQLPIEVASVMANHEDLKSLAEFYKTPFEHHEIHSAEDKQKFEARVEQFIEEQNIELIVLARYMQILSPEFCEKYSGRIINIHHSFLPGFKGANPYAQAHERGVKLIGATAHFVTQDLDEGPIIEQNVDRVTHEESKQKLVRIGQDIESRTLAQAVNWFAEHRVLLDGSRTVIFS